MHVAEILFVLLLLLAVLDFPENASTIDEKASAKVRMKRTFVASNVPLIAGVWNARMRRKTAMRLHADRRQHRGETVKHVRCGSRQRSGETEVAWTADL
mmetsp:Transcript_32974/g.72320  ORF Transcript_32974/g.72320 Transcript_32974/m.72320 type:complete len:99 (-) Transcript_32974:12-308(-)